MLARKFADAASDIARTGERDHGDIWIAAKRLAGLGASWQNLEDALRQTRFLEDTGYCEAAGQRRPRIGLEHDRIAGRERGRHRAARQDQREVEGRDDADDAARQAASKADPARVGRQHQALGLGTHGGGTIEDFRHQMDLESGLGRDAPGFPRNPRDQLFLIVFQRPRSLAQDGGALFIRGRRPSGLGGSRFRGGASHVLRPALPTRVMAAPVAGSTTSIDPPSAARHSEPNRRPRQVDSIMNFGTGAFISIPLLLHASALRLAEP